jgi:membrane protein YqaA with SNARE-associated domain
MTYDLLAPATGYSHGVIHRLFHILASLGGFGLLTLSFLDSSPLFIPFGNDFLMIVMTANKHSLLVYYALMATAGSALGCLTVDALSRKGGEEGLERAVPPKRLNYIKKRIKKNAAWALAVASLMPPPFPFTGFVAGAAALQYPRKRLLLIVSFSRLVRFLIEGALGIFFGPRLLGVIRSPAVAYIVVAIVVVSIAGSALVILKWIKGSKVSTAAHHPH